MEGCECRVIGSSKCEFPDTLKEAPFKLTGVAPSIPTKAGGKDVRRAPKGPAVVERLHRRFCTEMRM